MKSNRFTLSFLLFIIFISFSSYSNAQKKELRKSIEDAMLKATKYMVEEVSTNGGYVWYYLPDFSRRWGEMEAFETMIWLQHPGTISMGYTFLDAYNSTGNEYYYEAAEKAANAIVWGQSNKGGWNYMIDFAGDRSLKKWYNTVGKNGWRLEEFQHYYGNSTFDDDITSDAARFLLRIYLEKLDPVYKPAIDKAIDFILESQYPLGGWPQRYPLRYDFSKQGHPDYTSFYTFNDDVTWENIHFLIQCYLTLGEERFLDPVNRGMNFYIISQHESGAWAQQLNQQLEPMGARTYETEALLPSTTYANAMLLLEFYKITGNKKFLSLVPYAIKWLKETRLPEDKIEGERTHPTFVDIDSNQPIYMHRKGSNVKYGYYYTDTNDKDLLAHYYGKTRVNLQSLIDEYNALLDMPVDEATKFSPLKAGKFGNEGTPQSFYKICRKKYDKIPSEKEVDHIINLLDNHNRWMSKHAYISNPYVGDGKKQEETGEYASSNVGDETDTSPYRDTSEQEYISTASYIRNIHMLSNYLKFIQNPDEFVKQCDEGNRLKQIQY
jgi:PelA/Pel-15E family pectate lyase